MRSYRGVKEIWQVDPQTLGIKWTDNSEMQFDVVHLRRKCPCAVCIDENTGKPKLSHHDISETVRPRLIKNVGRYALTIQFNDGHGTGIYTYEYLTKLNQ